MKYSIIVSTVMAFGAFAVISTTQANATVASAADCVSGTSRDDFESTWQGNDTISVKTRSGKPVCSDVTMYFSSYTLPATYNGEKFSNNPTAYPQQQFDSKKFVIAKGLQKSESIRVNLPDSCTKDSQVDVYLGPEIKVVGAEGHEGRGIKGSNGNNRIIAKKTCEAPVAPVTPVAPIKSVESVKESAETEVATVTELPQTGNEATLGLGLMAAILTAGAAYLVRR